MTQKPEKWLKPWHMGVHLKVLSMSYLMNTNMTGLYIYIYIYIYIYMYYLLWIYSFENHFLFDFVALFAYFYVFVLIFYIKMWGLLRKSACVLRQVETKIYLPKGHFFQKKVLMSSPGYSWSIMRASLVFLVEILGSIEFVEDMTCDMTCLCLRQSEKDRTFNYLNSVLN